MSEKLRNNFEELIRNKLEDYQTPVESDNWSAIEKSLTTKRRVRYLYVTAVSVAAAGVMFLLRPNLPDTNIGTQLTQSTLLSDNTSKNNNQGTDPDTTKLDNTVKIENVEQNTKPVIAKSQSKPKQESTASNDAGKQAAATADTVVIDYDPESKLATICVAPTQPNRINSLKTLENSKMKLDISGLKTLSTPESNLMSDNLQKDYQPVDNNPKKWKSPEVKNNRNWVASVNFGAGNYQNINGQNSGMSSQPLLATSSSKEYIKNTYKNSLGLPDNAESHYGVPLSGKISIRKNLNSTWAVETGLSYTYLSTKYNWSQNVVKQQLHYVGVPVNVVYYAVSQPSWNLYASAGGTVEKGVRATVSRNDEVSSTIKMKGLQFSANAAVGVTYKLYNNIGMFFEPQIGYFFDNKQPESIRTASPISFNLGLGLRYNF